MKTLSIRPPWAWAILNLGKRIENRTWETRYRGPLLIHAGKAITKDDCFYVARHCKRLGIRMPEKHELKIGGIVAKATLVDIVEKSNDPFYADGCFGWVLDNVKPVKFAPVIGKLGLFDTPWPIKSS